MDSIVLNSRDLKTIIGYLKVFNREHLNLYDYLFPILYTAGFVYLNYSTPLVSDLVDPHRHRFTSIPFYMLFYAVPFIGGILFSAINHRDYVFLGNWRFWFTVVFALFVFAMRSTSHVFFDDYWLSDMRFWKHGEYYYKIFSIALKWVVVFGLIFLYWRISGDYKKQPFYGFTLKNFSTKPYFAMLGIMLPLIVLASTQSDFLGQYPIGTDFGTLDSKDPENRWYFFIYEIFYGSGFLGIEFFFRGFIILALIEYAGPRILIPMALFYMTIHFGKPAGELVSSLFGGSILAIVTYYSKSIIGGIIVHVGIAWLMELGAYIGNL